MVEQLDRDHPAQPFVASTVDDPEAAPPHFALDDVRTHSLAVLHDEVYAHRAPRDRRADGRRDQSGDPSPFPRARSRSRSR